MNIFRENHLNQSIRINELQYDDLTKKADPQKDQISFVFYRLIVQPDKGEGNLGRSADVPPFLEWTSQEAMHLDCKIINIILTQRQLDNVNFWLLHKYNIERLFKIKPMEILKYKSLKFSVHS